jgi:hypothetical protein
MRVHALEGRGDDIERHAVVAGKRRRVCTERHIRGAVDEQERARSYQGSSVSWEPAGAVR